MGTDANTLDRNQIGRDSPHVSNKRVDRCGGRFTSTMGPQCATDGRANKVLVSVEAPHDLKTLEMRIVNVFHEATHNQDKVTGGKLANNQDNRESTQDGGATDLSGTCR